MNDVLCRIDGAVGRITLQRPDALNALSHDMCLQIEAALDEWRDAVELVMIDALGDKAFCAGGDVTSLYESAGRGDIAFGRTFWQDEYRLNAKIDEYPKPVVSFLQGFVMGGGVGLGCHGSHRIVCESSKIAMPECAIGLVPDVGGSLLLATAPGHLGKYLGLTGARMGAGDAIFAGFADSFVPYDEWPALKAKLLATGDIKTLANFIKTAPASEMSGDMDRINAHFQHDSLSAILASLRSADPDVPNQSLKGLGRNAPLAMACCIEILKRSKDGSSIRDVLAQEFRFTARAVKQGDFIEGVRAAIIDKDNAPKWAHGAVDDVTDQDIDAMLADLGDDGLDLGPNPRSRVNPQ